MIETLHFQAAKMAQTWCYRLYFAKGGALRERRNVRTSGGSISLVGNGIAYNGQMYI